MILIFTRGPLGTFKLVFGKLSKNYSCLNDVAALRGGGAVYTRVQSFYGYALTVTFISILLAVPQL